LNVTNPVEGGNHLGEETPRLFEDGLHRRRVGMLVVVEFRDLPEPGHVVESEVDVVEPGTVFGHVSSVLAQQRKRRNTDLPVELIRPVHTVRSYMTVV